MVFVGDIRNVRVDGVYLAEIRGSGCGAGCLRLSACNGNYRRGSSETVDIGRFQVGVAYGVVAVIGGLEPVRVERIEGQPDVDVACVLSDQHPGLQVVEGIGGA